VTTATVALRLNQPLDLSTTFSSGQAFRWRADGTGGWTGVLDGELVRLWQDGPELLVESQAGVPMANQVLAYLRMDDDLPAIQARLCADQNVALGIQAYPGLRVLRQDPWETLAAFILSATSNIPRIARTVEAIAKSYGDEVSMDGLTRYAFPPPDRLVEAGEAALRRLGCGFRAPYLAGAAQAVASGELRLNGLRGRPYGEVSGALMALHGVGEKIADCVMLFALDRLEAFPVDRWVRRALEQWYGIGPLKRYADARDWAQAKFGADAGYANQHLFWRIRQGNG
jgi:N-glycosylase/DNA lyase